MTRSEMMAIVTAMLETSGRPYVTVAADQNAAANRQLAKFTERALCLYDDAIPFTLTPSTAVYDLRGGALTKKVCLPESITINGAPLRDEEGELRPLGLDDLRNSYPTYLATAAALPFRWAQIPPTSIRLYPAPDQAYANSYVAGHYLHPVINTGAPGDSVELSIPDEYCEAAAAFVAIGLVVWLAATESDYERMAMFSQKAAAEMKELEQKGSNKLSGPRIRGQRRSGGVVSLG